jgi:site-specific recombinase XerD
LRTGGKYLGHANVETTMIYAHVVKELWTSARGPLDIIQTRRAP